MSAPIRWWRRITGCAAFNDIPRNMPDELLKKLAAKGGVIGFQIGNEFHNRKVVRLADEACRQAVLGHDARFGKKEAEMSIDEIDKIVAPQFPDGRRAMRRKI